MECKDKNGNPIHNKEAEPNQPKTDVKDVSEFAPGSEEKNLRDNVAHWKVGQSFAHGIPAEDVNTPGEVNMEASILPDDVMQAGGFGARDDISSFLPVASDSTDFEAIIRDARDYEEPQEQISRPGLGWTKGTKKE